MDKLFESFFITSDVFLKHLPLEKLAFCNWTFIYLLSVCELAAIDECV